MAEHTVFLLLLIWKYACQESTHQHTQYLGFHKLHLPTPTLWCLTCQPQPDGVLAGWFLIIRFYLTSWSQLCQGKHGPLFLTNSLASHLTIGSCGKPVLTAQWCPQQKWPNNYATSKKPSRLVLRRKILRQHHFSMGHVTTVLWYLKILYLIICW